MVELANKNVKTATVTVFKNSKENMNIVKIEVENIKMNLTELLAMRSKQSELKISLNEITCRLDTAEGFIDIKDIAIELINNEAQEDK